MTNSQRAEQIQQAIELIQEAQDLVEEAVNDTRSESHFQAYNKYGFNQLLGNGNPYDSSLYNLIDELKEEAQEEEEIKYVEIHQDRPMQCNGLDIDHPKYES